MKSANKLLTGLLSLGVGCLCAGAVLAQGLSGGIRTRNLTGVFLGDSHTNGMIEATTTSDTFALTTSVMGGARDFVWAGTARAPYFRFDSQINSVTSPSASNDQTNSAVGTSRGSYVGLVPASLRTGNPHIGEITVANLGVGGSSAYTWAGEPAQAYIGYIGTPGDGNTITVCGQAYRFKNTPAQVYDVQIGTTTASLTNLMNAINAEGSGWFAGTAVNANCYAPNTPQSSIYLRVNALQVGTAGNALSISSSNQSGITSLNSGLAAVASMNLAGGSATSALYVNGKAALNGGSGIGHVDFFAITLGSNDSNRPGYRCRNTANDYATLITNIQADYPGVPIFIWVPITISTSGAATAALTNVCVPAVRALQGMFSNLYAIDVFALGTGSSYTLIGPGGDGVHATNYGYWVFAQMLSAKITTVLGLN